MMLEIKITDRFSGKWMEIDEQTNAIDYLRRTCLFLSETVDSKWKWVVIALHGALYSFCILAVQGTNPYDPPPGGSGTVTRKGSKEYLISFPEALRRVQADNIVNPPVVLNDDQKKRFDLLNKILRNNFIHFTPKGQSIEISGIPEILLDSIAVIEHIVCKASSIFRLDAESKSVIEGLIKDIRSKVEAMMTTHCSEEKGKLNSTRYRGDR